MSSEYPQSACSRLEIEDWIDQQLEEVDNQISELMEREAQQIISAFWEHKKTANSNKPSSQKSKLNVRLKASQDKQHFAIEWQVYKGHYQKGNTSYAINLNKCRNQQSYTERELKKWAKPWELSHVLEVEVSLTKIRQQYALLLQIRKDLKSLNKKRHEFLKLWEIEPS